MPLWKEDQEVAKRSDRDESMWVAIHMFMEATLEISLCSYLYLKLTKTLPFLLSLMFSLQQNREEEGRTGSAWKRCVGGLAGWWVEVTQSMCTYVSKCENDKK
jgi:hypothetical protein